MGKESKAQELGDLQNLLGQEYDAELAALERKKNLYAQGTAEYEEALNQEDVLLQKYLADYQKINQQIAQANADQIKKTQEEYKSFFDTIDKDLDQMLQGVLQGTTTWQLAMEHLFSNLALSVIEDFAKIALKALALQAINISGNGGGALGGAVAGEVPQALGGTQSNSSNPLTAAITALTTALGITSTATQAQTAINQGMSAAQQVVGTATTTLGTATLANTTATIANTVAESTGGASGGAGAIASIGSWLGFLDVGSWSLPSDGLAFLHAGEMVVPPAQAAAIRSGSASIGGASSSGGTFNFTVQAIDTQTGMAFLQSNAASIATIVAGQIRNGNSNLTNALRA
jgi:hypothetical protein